MNRYLQKGLLFSVIFFLVSCATPVTYDYAKFREHQPRSILILPPINETSVYHAPYKYLSTLTRPLAECGYYVFPVSVIERLMKENGLPSVDQMHSLALDKIDEIIGADAVLYVTVEKWGQKFIVTQSITEVSIRYELVDVKTGDILWQGRQYSKVGTNRNGSSDQLIVSTIDQTTNKATQQIHEVARHANYATFSDSETGLLAGPYLKDTEFEHCLPLALGF